MAFTQKADAFQEQWATIKKLCSSSHRQFAVGTIYINETPPDELYNLPVVLAFSLLDEVLGEFAEQGAYRTRPGAMLGKKMRDSKDHLPWTDFAGIEAAKDRRNDLAHKGNLIPRDDCLQIVEMIGTELRSFGAIS